MKGRLGVLGLLLVALPACERLDSFDTSKSDAAYCGPIVDAAFIRTSQAEGGFAHEARLKVEIDTSKLTSAPATITSDDDGCGEDSPTFQNAEVRVPSEIPHDPLSSMTFEDGQVQNLVGWVKPACRPSVFVVVSLLKTDKVDVRLMEARDQNEKGVDVFSLFSLQRNETGCGF